MGELNLVTTFTGSIIISLFFGFIAHKMKVSPIIGYLIAGIIVGPSIPGFTADPKATEQLAEIGVILLMFGIGLKFQLTELLAVWKVAIPGALMQSTLSTFAAAALLRLCGWPWHSGIILGMAISVASTVVMARVLSDKLDIHTQIGHIAIGWTVVEDILTVMMLLALPMIFGEHVAESNMGAMFGIATFKIIALAVCVVVLGKWVLPRALGVIAATRSSELFTLAVLALALGIAASAYAIFGVSIELGAFLAGLAVGRSEFAARAAGEAIPMRDAFAVLFFVSVGMMFNPYKLMETPIVTLSVLFVVVVVKPLSAILTVRILGKPLAIAIPVGAAFSQIGEFSFILGKVAHSLGILNDSGWNTLIAASIISIAMNPLIYSWARSLRITDDKSTMPKPEELPPPNPNRCVIIGYGPVGKTVYNILSKKKNADITIIELNLNTVHELRKNGISALYGDALRPGILEKAGVIGAGSLILSANLPDGAEIIKRAHSLNTNLRILARTEFLRGAKALKRAGAAVVAAGEAEVAVALADAVGIDDDKEVCLREKNDIRTQMYCD